jgi:hypothetical protein
MQVFDKMCVGACEAMCMLATKAAGLQLVAGCVPAVL